MIEEQAHELGDRQRRMRVVELNGDLVGQRAPARIRMFETSDDVGQRAADQEIFLDEAQHLAGPVGVVRIEDARDGAGEHMIEDGADEIAGVELGEVEVIGGGSRPQPERVDGPPAVTDHRTIVRNAEQNAVAIRNGTERAVDELEAAGDRHVDSPPVPGHLPRIGMLQPRIGMLDLDAVADLLAKDAVFVAQPVAHRRDLQRGQRVDEASGETAQPAVAQSGVRFALDHFLPVLPRVRAQILPHELLDSEVDDVVDQRAADQKLHRQVIDALGIFGIVRLLRQQPALRQQIAQRTRDGFETLALVGVLQQDGVVEHDMAIVEFGIPVGEAERTTFVLFQHSRDGFAAHERNPLDLGVPTF